MLKASNFNELDLKATTAFKANPNSTTLTYNDPNGDKMLLDNEDTYEYVEQRCQELKAENASYKPSIILGGDDSQPVPSQTQNLDFDRSHTRVSIIGQAIAPISPRGGSESEGKVIFQAGKSDCHDQTPPHA